MCAYQSTFDRCAYQSTFDLCVVLLGATDFRLPVIRGTRVLDIRGTRVLDIRGTRVLVPGYEGISSGVRGY